MLAAVPFVDASLPAALSAEFASSSSAAMLASDRAGVVSAFVATAPPLTVVSATLLVSAYFSFFAHATQSVHAATASSGAVKRAILPSEQWTGNRREPHGGWQFSYFCP